MLPLTRTALSRRCHGPVRRSLPQRRRQRYMGAAALALACAFGVLLAFRPTPADAGHGLRRRLSGVGCDNLAWKPLSAIDSDPAEIFVGFLIILYCFVGLAIVCDEFFEPSLCVIAEHLKLTPDVAGATFLAAGSSAPELFTSVGDAFGPENSIGMGTIVGSAMFNILVIVALSSAVAGGTLNIDWRPVARDVSFYCASIILLAIFFQDSKVQWEESLVMVLAYVGYVVFMKFNSRIMARCSPTPPCTGGSKVHADKQQAEAERAAVTAAAAAVADAITGTNTGARGSGSGDGAEGAPGDANAEPASPSVRLKPLPSEVVQHARASLPGTDPAAGEAVEAAKQQDEDGQSGEGGGDDDDDEDDGGILDWPDTLGEQIFHVISLPLKVAMKFTIPDCDDERFAKWFYVTFLMSILWIGALCYVMVALASELACGPLNMNPVLMGVLVLAVGTSVPDAIGSMIASRKGEADMAIANAIGSNVFDILLGLGLPWVLRSWTQKGMPPVCVDRSGVTVSVAILFGTVWLFLGVLVLSKWQMTKRLGIALFTLYVIYVAYNLIKVAVDDPPAADSNSTSCNA